jgi:hypothetical protein
MEQNCEQTDEVQVQPAYCAEEWSLLDQIDTACSGMIAPIGPADREVATRAYVAVRARLIHHRQSCQWCQTRRLTLELPPSVAPDF